MALVPVGSNTFASLQAIYTSEEMIKSKRVALEAFIMTRPCTLVLFVTKLPGSLDRLGRNVTLATRLLGATCKTTQGANPNGAPLHTLF